MAQFNLKNTILILLLPSCALAFTQHLEGRHQKPFCNTGTIRINAGTGSSTIFFSSNLPDNDVETTDMSNTSYRPGSLMAATAQQGRVPYGESSRKYRRTEFSYDDWVDHRNSDKNIVTNVKGMFFSGIIRQLGKDIKVITLVAASLVLWNDFIVPNDLFSGYLPRVVLPPLPFQLSSPALGLLLVFKTNASYGRWLEARNSWAKIVSQSRNIIRMSSTFAPQTIEGKESIEELTKAIWLLCRSLMNELSDPGDEDDFHKEVSEVFQMNGSSYMRHRDIVTSADRTMTALAQATIALDNVPIDEKRRVEIDKSLVLIGDCISVCEKIYTSPVPLVYTRHTGRFLSLWMILLPAAMYDTFYDESVASSFQCLALIPTASIVGIFLFGIDELAIQLEEPFSILPMQSFCDNVRKSANVISGWTMASVKSEIEVERPTRVMDRK